MTDERPTDDIVSARYRELADETTPAHLDDAVLRMAASRAQHPQYSRSMTWTRPLAWAATIALCLAITLELTRGLAIDPIVSESSLQESLPEESAPEELLPASRGRAADSADFAASPAPAMSLPAQKSEAASEPPATTNEFKEHELRESDVPVLDKLAHPSALKIKDSDESLRRSEQLSVGATPAVATKAPCSDAAKSEPETWLLCIQDLEEAGDTEAALREKESLIEVFPDFRLP